MTKRVCVRGKKKEVAYRAHRAHGAHYLWGGRSWGSLSSIARAITGTRRNGPAFFGLRDREAP